MSSKVSPRPGAPSAVLGGALLFALLASSCTGGGAPAGGKAQTRSPEVARLSGTVLASRSAVLGGLSDYELPLGSWQNLRVPADWTSYQALAAAPGPSGTAYAFEPGGDHLYRLSATEAPRRLGPPLPSPVRYPFAQVSVESGRLAVAACPGAYVLDLSRPAAWLRVAASACISALSPDGRSIAYWDAGAGTIGRAPVASGAPASVLFRLPEVGGGRASKVSMLRWGPGGVAFAETRNLAELLGVWTPKLGVRVLSRGSPNKYQEGAEAAWQPGGHLLAYADEMGGGAESLRVTNPATGASSILFLDPGGLGGVVWAPDGRALVTQQSSGAWVFLDLRGDWLRRVNAGAGPSVFFGWTDSSG